MIKVEIIVGGFYREERKPTLPDNIFRPDGGTILLGGIEYTADKTTIDDYGHVLMSESLR